MPVHPEMKDSLPHWKGRKPRASLLREDTDAAWDGGLGSLLKKVGSDIDR